MPRLLILLVSVGALVHAQGTAVQVPFPGGITGSVWGSGQPPSPQTPSRDRRADEIKPGTATIRGQVVAADTGAPLRRAQIRVFNTSGPNGGGMAQTDAQGRFELTQLPAGRYNITASRAGYVTMQLGQRAPNQSGTPLELADGQVADKVGFALVRGGAISGRIADEFGEPVSGAQVNVQRYAYMGGTRRLTGGGEGGFDRTDDLGQFRLYGLTPGDYYVTATLRTMEFMPMNTTAVSPPMDGYAPTYFPGTPSLADARRVTVRAGQDVMNVTFALSAAKVGRISGRVTTSSGAPYVGAMLMVGQSGDGIMGFNTTGAPIRPDGTFQTAGLPPGNYTLTVQPAGNRFGNPGDQTAEVARLDVPMNGDDVRDVLIVTGRGGIIRGRVVTDDGSVPTFSPHQVRVMPQAEDFGRPMMMGMNPNTVREDWTFEVSGLIDRVRLRASVDVPGGGWALKGAFSNGTNLSDVAADIGPGQVIDDVELVITNKITELSGVIVDDRNQPVTDASVVIFTDNKASWSFGSRYLRTSRPDTNGKYTLRLTPADGYRAIVVRGLEEGQASDPEFLASALDRATAFEIREGEAKTLNLKVVEVK